LGHFLLLSHKTKKLKSKGKAEKFSRNNKESGKADMLVYQKNKKSFG